MNEQELSRAAELLAAGEVVAIPTETVYGLAADPRVPGAAARIFAIKGRPDTVALPVLAPSKEAALELADGVPPEVDQVLDRWWPGPLTVVLPRSPASASWELGGDPETIGLRCPAHEGTLALLRRTGTLAVTSANAHGSAPLHTAESVRRAFGASIPLVADGGRCDGQPSTVATWTADGWVILRHGPVPLDDRGTLG